METTVVLETCSKKVFQIFMDAIVNAGIDRYGEEIAQLISHKKDVSWDMQISIKEFNYRIVLYWG